MLSRKLGAEQENEQRRHQQRNENETISHEIFEFFDRIAATVR